MHQPDDSGSRYCDINFEDPERCVEIDLVEANRHAFRATAHTADDGSGEGSGLGGGASAFGTHDYGPGAATIDTETDVEIRASKGQLKVMPTGMAKLALAKGAAPTLWASLQ